MGGGLLQLVAYGAQDIYLTGQPQITFWKSVYRRHTNFAIESIVLNPDDDPGLDTRTSIPITRNGDLLKRLWIQVNVRKIYLASIGVTIANDIYSITTLCNDFCHSLFKEIELEIGGQVIDRLYSSWLSIWRNLSEENPYGSVGCIGLKGERELSQSTSFYNKMSYTNAGLSVSTPVNPGPTQGNSLTLNNGNSQAYIPLPFWFCKNPGLALPLIALQYHDVRINITFSNFSNIGTSLYAQQNNSSDIFDLSKTIQFYGDYVFLDSVERKQFADNTHEYLIEQLQKKVSQKTNNIKLSFTGPVKEIIIAGQPGIPIQISDSSANALTSNNVNFVVPMLDTSRNEIVLSYNSYKLKYFNKPWVYSTYGIGSPLPILISSRSYLYSFGGYNGEYVDNISRTNVNLKLVINGKDQFSKRNLKYFTRKTLWETHKGVGSGNWGEIAVIPFCLNPQEYQPSGAVNFSMINDVRLLFDNFDTTIGEQLSPLDIYAVSYNILKITSGMGGVVYAR